MNGIGSNTISVLKNNQIGPWKLGETLGSGSTGKVLLASNENTKQQAAIKVISKAVFEAMNNSDENGSALPYNIEQEIIIMKLLNHPNVLRLYDVWETNTDLYLVLEYAEKGELFNMLVERGPLPENEAVRAFRQIIIGISYCHSLGVVHRDLKPENLLLDNKLNIKIADFGMAALESDDKLLETSCGSPHYAAPEIISGLPYEGFASDVWSCGVILFALLTGRLPFDEEDGNIRNLLLKVQKGEFEMPEDDEITKEAQDLLARILTVDPKKRVTIRDILKHPLLQKYPSIKDSRSIRNLPREDTYLSPLADTNSKIDETILQNLVILWHGKDANEIAEKLRQPGANTEKTLYALLYRFKCDTQKEAARANEMRKRQSRIQRNSTIRTNNESPSKRASFTPQKKKNRISMISVSSSSAKKPVTISKVGNNPSNNSSVTGTPKSAKRMSMNASARKRMAALYGTRESPIKDSRSRRSSIINRDMVGGHVRDSVIGKSKNKRASKAGMRKSLAPNLKRESVTTKLIATYAKLSEDDDWEYIERETKRTSSNFATLIDEIFEYEKYEQIRKEKAELERKVRETKEREERERQEREERERREREERERIERQKDEISRQMDEEIDNLKRELSAQGTVADNNQRAVSAPLESTTTKMEALEEDINVILRNRKVSLQTRPKSRLDPGIGFGESSRVASAPIEQVTEADPDLDITEQKILETIRRSKFLGSSFDIKKELEKAKKNRQTSSQLEVEAQPPALPQTMPTVAERRQIADASMRKLSDVKVPEFTRKSRHFSNSNRRLSVLSMYSTKESYSNLADILKNGPDKDLLQKAPSPKSADDSDQLFETIEEAETPASISREDRLYDVGEDSEDVAGKNIDIADLLTSEGDNLKSSQDETELKLPKLPPLFEKEKEEKPTAESKSTSMIPEDKDEVNAKKNASDIENDGGSLNPFMTKHRKETKPEKHTKDDTTEQPARIDSSGNDKKRNMSFLRKFSKGSSKEFSDITISTGVSSKQLYNGLVNLLKGWTKYGLKNVTSDSSSQTISGKLSSDNIFSFRSTAFTILVFSQGKGSAVTFKKLTGSGKAVARLSEEVKKVLAKEGVLKQ
ncbi:protein kinase GIN4 [Nakaseomyces bracarensis]|uniref:protein kinase GIN4 n=1 Tax=Nakaseomyces bracarensis TaxID=273131 RepID=UPI00387276DC